MAIVINDEHAWLFLLPLAMSCGGIARVLPSLHTSWDVTVPPLAVIDMQ